MSASFLRHANLRVRECAPQGIAALLALTFASVLPTGGCTPRCSHAPDPLPVSGCVLPPSGFDRYSGTSFDAALDLEVVEATVSVDSAGCFSAVPVGGYAEPGLGETVDFVVLRNPTTGETWRIGSMVEGAFDALRTGDAVHLTAHFSAGRLGGGGSDLLLVRADGSLAHWCGDSTEVGGLRPPSDFAIRRGDAQCRGKDSCGRWTEYGLVFSHGGRSAAANYGRVAALDGYRVLTGGVTANEGGLRHCSDGGGGWASAAISAIDPSATP